RMDLLPRKEEVADTINQFSNLTLWYRIYKQRRIREKLVGNEDVLPPLRRFVVRCSGAQDCVKHFLEAAFPFVMTSNATCRFGEEGGGLRGGCLLVELWATLDLDSDSTLTVHETTIVEKVEPLCCFSCLWPYSYSQQPGSDTKQSQGDGL